MLCFTSNNERSVISSWYLSILPCTIINLALLTYLLSILQCSLVITRSIFSKIFTKDTPYLACKGEVWGVSRWHCVSVPVCMLKWHSTVIQCVICIIFQKNASTDNWRGERIRRAVDGEWAAPSICSEEKLQGSQKETSAWNRGERVRRWVDFFTISLPSHFQMYFPGWECLNFDYNFTTICSVDSMSSLVQVMAWCETGAKPSLEVVMTNDHVIIWHW